MIILTRGRRRLHSSSAAAPRPGKQRALGMQPSLTSLLLHAEHSANCASCSTSKSSPFAVGRHFGSPPGAAFAMIPHHPHYHHLLPLRKKFAFSCPTWNGKLLPSP